MPVHVKVGGAWKQATAVFNKVGGVWKTAADMPVKIGGVWKTGILASGAYESIATYSATGSETSFTFSSIPQTYAHLQLRVIARQATGSGTTGEWCTYYLNGSTTGSDYTLHGIQATGSAVQGNWGFTDNGAVNAFYIAGNGLASSIFGVGISDFQDYSSTTKLKTIRNIGGVDANGSGSLFITSALFRQTNAITSIQITGSGSRAWATGTTFSLYGIKGA